MKATGIVRRIDDLGRVVVPKEIRRTLRIREGEPMEIFTGREGEIVLKKYSPIGEMSKYAKELAEAIAQSTGHLVCISDHDQIVAATGQDQKEYYGKSISKELEKIIANREVRQVSDPEKDGFQIVDSVQGVYTSMIIQPIISAGDAIGAVILLNSKGDIAETEQKLVQVAAAFLGKQMEG